MDAPLSTSNPDIAVESADVAARANAAEAHGAPLLNLKTWIDHSHRDGSHRDLVTRLAPYTHYGDDAA